MVCTSGSIVRWPLSQLRRGSRANQLIPLRRIRRRSSRPSMRSRISLVSPTVRSADSHLQKPRCLRLGPRITCSSRCSPCWRSPSASRRRSAPRVSLSIFTVYLTDALHEALPGLVGAEGIDPAQLRAVGRSSSIVGLLLLLYAGGGAMGAASGSMHLIYGAPPDPRNFLISRARLLGLLIVIAPLILVSFAIPNLVASATRNAQAL